MPANSKSDAPPSTTKPWRRRCLGTASKVLRGWVALVLLMAVAVSFDLAFWQALLACALGWGVFELLNRVPLLDLDRLEAWLWREGAGKTLQRDVDSLVDDVADKGAD